MKCYTCHELNKPMYIKNGKVKGACIDCYNSHYLKLCKTKEDKKVSLYKASKKARIKRQEYILNYLKENPCKDCGEKNLYVLEFDHKDPKLKINTISKLIACGSWVTLIDEINKCDVVCANCHRVRTQKMFGSWRHNLILKLV